MNKPTYTSINNAHNDGKEFEIRVSKVLESLGYIVQSEIQIASKRVDLFATSYRFGGIEKIAVECKDWKKGLSRDNVISIFNSYDELLSLGEVDEILIICRTQPSANALAWVNKRLGVRIQTLEKLERTILNFSGYLALMSNRFEKLDVSRFYQEPYTSDGDNLMDLIQDWIHEAPNSQLAHNRPIAILGSYGIGKSTFAAFLTSTLAKEALKDDRARIPILIDLGSLAKEQELEGLIGAYLGSPLAKHEIPNYNFSVFEKLNREGRFVIILDGLDEMRHLTSLSELRFNMGQLSRLVEGASKVILLGRPSAFESEEEMINILGTDSIQPDYLADGIHFQRREMELFNDEQIRLFIKDFYSDEVNSIDVEKFFHGSFYKDLARRPVQLWMLMKIIPEFVGDPESLNVEELYEITISNMINKVIANLVSRQDYKTGGRELNNKVRRVFLQRLAFWMWEERRNMRVVSGIPDAICEEFTKPFDDIDRIRRDLLATAPIERHRGDRLVFPHRSIQEFLVAKECLYRLISKKMTLQEFDSFATDEIANFVKGSRVEGDLSKLRTSVSEYAGSLRWRTVNSLLLPTNNDGDFVRSENSALDSCWEILLANAKSISAGSRLIDRKVFSLINEILDGPSQVDSDVLYMSLFVIIVGRNERELDGLRVKLIEKILRSILRAGTQEILDRNILLSMSKKKHVVGKKWRGGAYSKGNDGIVFGGNLSLKPIGKEFIGELRDGMKRLAVRQGGGHLIAVAGYSSKLDIAGGTKMQIVWLPQTTVELCELLYRRTGHFEGTSVLRIIARRLASVAFVSDWFKASGELQKFDLIRPFIVPSGIFSVAESISESFAAYEEYLIKNSSQRAAIAESE